MLCKKRFNKLAITVVILSGLLFFLLQADRLYDEIYPAPSADTDTGLTQQDDHESYQAGAVVAGFDWELPHSADQTPYSGLIEGEYEKNVAAHKFLIVRWDKTNPRQNLFDFSTLKNQLKRIYPKKALIRLEVNSACEAPDWALETLRQSEKKSLIFWDHNYLALLKPYLERFGAEFSAHPQVLGVQLGIGDGEYRGSCDDYSGKDGWGEFWMRPEELAEAEERFGLKPKLLYRSTIKIIDAYREAFRGQEGKLVFTGAGIHFSWTERSHPYDAYLQKISRYAIDAGIGGRDGQVESWLRYLDSSHGIYFNQQAGNTCSLEMDESFAELIKGRYWGTENEFYGTEQYITDENGPDHNQPYRYLVSSLRALQMRRNFMSIHASAMEKLDHPVYKTRQFLVYLKNTLGKQIEDTPDLFVLLGERYVAKRRIDGISPSAERCLNNDMVAVRSFGRWLSETSDSEAAIRIHMPKEEKYWGQGITLPHGIDYEYAARKGKFFLFDIEDALSRKRCQAKACDVDIKLTYRDDIKTRLSVRVAEGTKQALKTNGDGKIKTATFNLQSTFSNGLKGHDFEVTAEHPLPIILVRVNLL